MSHKYFIVRLFPSFAKIRFGNLADSGYTLTLFSYFFPNPPLLQYDAFFDCGLGNNVSFTKQWMKHYNMSYENSFSYDYTIDSFPDDSINIQFFPFKIDATNNPYSNPITTNLHNEMLPYYNIFMKMDIEGYEYPWLLSLSIEQLSKIKQFIVEFHGVNDDSWGTCYSDKIKCFEKLTLTHFIIHIHANNYGKVCYKDNIMIPDILEITYLNKNCFLTNNPPLNNIPFPIKGLDYPNSCELPEIILDQYPFCCK